MNLSRGLRHQACVCESCMNEGTVFLRPQLEVLDPFVKPRCFQGSSCNLAKGCRSVRAAECRECLLSARTDIWIAGIRLGTYARKHKERSKISLKKNVD